MSRQILKGSTDQSTIIRIVDSTDGTPETGVTSASGGLDLKYRREGGLTADLTESDLAAVDSAHSDGGMKHIGAGYYRVDLPDAACATGANGVLVFGTVTGMVVQASYHPLWDINPNDAVRAGMTALPNAAADAAGGLPVSDAGGLDLDAQVGTKINSILDDTGTAGVVVASIAANAVNASALAADAVAEINATVDTAISDAALATAAAVADLPTNAELATALAAADDAVLAAIAALNNLSAAAVNAEVVDALATDTYAEPAQGAPSATTTLAAKINYLYKAWRNKKDNDGTTTNLYADDGTTVDHKQTTGEAAGTVTAGEWATGA